MTHPISLMNLQYYISSKAKNYNLNVTEIMDSDFKNAFLGISPSGSQIYLVSENETLKSVFEIDHDCQVNDNVVEPSLECIRDCADVKYVCNCNVYRYRSNI